MGFDVLRAQLQVPAGGSAHQAVTRAQRYIAQSYNVVVDLDLDRFFDRVKHDILMSRVAARVTDKRVLKLIRAFLNAEVLENGLIRGPLRVVRWLPERKR
jgi:RNA-directed DNA polymerase